MLSSWLGARLGQKGFLIWEGLGGVAGGVGTIILGVIDIQNAAEAWRREKGGMVVLYATNAVFEIAAGTYYIASGVNLIFRMGLVFVEFNPIVLGISVAILIIGVVVEVKKDPPAMDWLRQCLWGSETNYRTMSEEMSNFNKALIG